MPVATVTTEAKKYDLDTLKGAWVSLRPLSYGQILQRREMAMKMSMAQDQGQLRGRRQDQVPSKIDFEMIQNLVRVFEFKHCIVDHNLTDHNGGKLNFDNDMTLRSLDPKIGQEIEELIDDLNREEEEEDLEGFTLPSSSSSETKDQTPTDEPGSLEK